MREVWAKIALRYDTSMSRAMLRALGIPAHARVPSSPVIVPVHGSGDYAWAFANHGSPMDGRGEK